MVVPGSGLVKQQAEAEGLDRIFLDAGFEWREPGCSMCLAMNADRLEPGERCASTSNRNFEGRQGQGGRTHLVSPSLAAAAAVAGHFIEPVGTGGLSRCRLSPYMRASSAPLDRSNVDTDAIIPKQYLKSVKRTGFGPNAFDDWRYLDPGEPDADGSRSAGRTRTLCSTRAPFDQATILLARKNFGCGSSREHAVWALDGLRFSCGDCAVVRRHLLQ
jgi:hypothetical protein